MKKTTRVSFACLIIVLLFSIFFYAQSKRLETVHSASVKPKEYTILIDAGHGGKDGGAIAADGTQEQYLNLAIARYLELHLNALGVHTQMTRKSDASVHDFSAISIREQKISDIHNRMEMLSQPACDALVSIHQNKYVNPKYWGAQVFYSPNHQESAHLASAIQKDITSLLQPNNYRKIKKSGSSIYLLYHSTKPAVLVECGFLSNLNELKLLKDENYQKQVAFSIAMGILHFLNA